MLILSKRTGIIYENICLEELENPGKVIDTEDMIEIDFSKYSFGYTRLCDKCIDIANKDGGVSGVYCFNYNCSNERLSDIYEVTFTREEIMNDLVVFNK